MEKEELGVKIISWLVIDNGNDKIEAQEFHTVDKETKEEVKMWYSLDICITNPKTGLYDITTVTDTTDFDEFKEATKKLVGEENFNKYWERKVILDTTNRRQEGDILN